MLNIAFKGKGLIRNSSYHCENFEMMGKRCSKQSTGSMLCLQLDVDKHQYFRETMDLGLLPQVRSIVNVLMEEAISTGNSCGCTLNTFYQRQLSMINEKQLCFHAIITQRNFFNTIHIDKSSVLSNQSKHTILNKIEYRKKRKNYNNEDRYVMEVLDNNQNQLPKSTTCCWCLRHNNNDYILKQYFVSPDIRFGLNLSSDILNNHNNVGATFYSSMFYHATTIPIWLHKKTNNIYLNGPDNMYNFAWGSNGGNKEET